LSKYKEEDDDPPDSSSEEESDSVSNYRAKRRTLKAETWGYLSILIRLWVVQEVRMAEKATIFCGRCSTKWKTLEEMSNNLSRHRRSTNPGIVAKLPFLARLALSASGIRRLALGYVDRGNLLSVLLGIRSLKATDPRG
jgi:hypothetical protein